MRIGSFVLLGALGFVAACGAWVTTVAGRRARAAERRVHAGMGVGDVLLVVEDWLRCHVGPDDEAPSSSSSPDRPFDVIVNGRGNYWVEGSGLMRDQEITSRGRLAELLAPPLSAGRAWRLVFVFDGIPTARLEVSLDGRGRVAQVAVLMDSF